MIQCLPHTGYTMPNGYGQVRREGKTWLAHRIVNNKVWKEQHEAG